MNLISCKSCGVVLDKDVLPFADKNHMYMDNGTIDPSKARWDGEDFVAIATCPSCGDEIDERGCA